MAEKGAKIKFVADTSKFNDSIKKANSEIKLMSAELKLNAKEMARTGESVEGLEKKHELLSNQLKASEDKTESLNQKIAKAIECFGENSTEVTNLRTQLANAKTEQEKFRMMLDSCNDKLDEQRRAEAELNSETRKLTDTISEQENELSKLKKEYVEATLEYGDASNEARQLAREIRELSGELNENKGKLSQASKKADDLDRSLDNVEQAAEDAGDGLSSIAGKIGDAGDGFSVLDGAISVFVGNGLSSLVGGIGDAISDFANLSEETQEYREDIVKLNTAFESAGHTTKQATSVYKELYSVFGEEDRAVEAAQQIANISKNEEDMTRMTEIATGAWARWGDSLATESLMEAINSTSKIGQVQGTLADALEWSGVNLDDFNKKLANNTEEEERSALILDTLEELYKEYATNYKQNNKSIIEARKATSDYNDVLAEMGEEIEPINTEVTELKTVLLKGLAPTIKKQVVPAFEKFTDELEDSGAIEDFSGLVGKLAEDGLPILADVIGFVTDNYEELAVGIGLAVVAFNTMSVVSKVTNALEGSTTAMGAFNAVMNANPIGAVVTSIGLLVGGFALLTESFEKAEYSFTILSDEEQDLIDKSAESADAFRDMQKTISESCDSIVAESDSTERLADQLLNLADANGKVDEANQTRAQFILNELNDALGTEYTMIDGVIQNYENLEKSIYDVIESKTAAALLETKNEEYLEARTKEAETLNAMTLAYMDYSAQLESGGRRMETLAKQISELNKAMDEGRLTPEYVQEQIETLMEEYHAHEDNIKKKKKIYEEATADYAMYKNKIIEYENASMLMQEKNYDAVIDMLSGKGTSAFQYSEDVTEATKEVINSLYEEAVEAGIAAKDMKKNFEEGVGKFTEEMVKEAEKGYEEALDKWANAYIDAESVGKDLSSGLEYGMTSKKSSLIQQAKNIVNGIIGAMRKEADSHSPSRKTIAFGEDIGEGAEIGLDNKTDDVVKSAKRQVNEVMNAYHLDLSKPISILGGINDLPMNQDVYEPLEQSINSGDLVSLSNAISELANRPVIVRVGDRTIAEVIASASDDVNGTRNTFISRGLILE